MAMLDPRVLGRSCNGCGLCCLLLSIEKLDKPKAVWCKHCSTKQACDIYDDRPAECEEFYCGYLTQVGLGEEWKPSKSKIVLMVEAAGDGERIAALVHPKRPDAWKKEPFYSSLKSWAIANAAKQVQVVVYIGEHVHVILPDKDVDLGIVDQDHRIITGFTPTPFGPKFDAYSLHKDDPRIQHLEE